jgi:hypothetical protein
MRPGEIDVRELGMDRVMQLPDHVFGEHHLIGLEHTDAVAGDTIVVSDSPLPEWIVVWWLGWFSGYQADYRDYCRIALAATPPADETGVIACAPLLADFGEKGPGARLIRQRAYEQQLSFIPLRTLVQSAGRYLVWYYRRYLVTGQQRRLALVYSTVPDTVPAGVVRAMGWEDILSPP